MKIRPVKWELWWENFPPPRSEAMQKVAQWLWALRLFDEISKSKLLPTAATHSSLISSFETWDEGERVNKNLEVFNCFMILFT